jgi:hypothetical protein
MPTDGRRKWRDECRLTVAGAEEANADWLTVAGTETRMRTDGRRNWRGECRLTVAVTEITNATRISSFSSQLVTEVKSDIELLLRADIITNLALERPGSKFPSTFIIKPKALAPLPLSPFSNHQAYGKPLWW